MESSADAGQALTEFVLVCGLFMLIFLGIWQTGRMLVAKQRQVMALRYGASLKAHTNVSYKNIESAMKRFVSVYNDELISANVGKTSLVDGQYCVSMQYKMKLPVMYYRRFLILDEDYYMARNSWANITLPLEK